MRGNGPVGRGALRARGEGLSVLGLSTNTAKRSYQKAFDIDECDNARLGGKCSTAGKHEVEGSEAIACRHASEEPTRGRPSGYLNSAAMKSKTSCGDGAEKECSTRREDVAGPPTSQPRRPGSVWTTCHCEQARRGGAAKGG